MPYDNRGRVGSCDFEYKVRKLLLIRDSDLGGKSVTNAIEDVLDYIRVRENIKCLDDYRIFYKDSDQRWTEVRLDTRGIVEFLTDGPETIAAMLEKSEVS